MTKFSGLLRLSLRLQLILAVAVVQAVLVSLFVWNLTERQSSMLLDRQVADAEAMAETVAISAAGWVAANDLAGLQEIVDAQRRDPEIEFAMAVDAQGLVLAHTEPTRIGQFVRDLPAESKMTVLNRSALLVDVACPVILTGRTLGWVRVGMSQRGAQVELGRITHNGVVYALIAIALGTAIAAYVGARLTSRIYAIRAVSQSVRSGHRAARVRFVGRDEVGQLATDFNEMLDGLSQKEREIEQLNAKLEHRVEERTKELAEAVELNRKLIETATLGILVFEFEGQCVLANEAASRAIGGSIEQLQSQNFRQIASWGKSGLRDAAEQVLATGLPQRIEINIFTTFQRELVLDCALSRFEARGHFHLLLTFTDITERKRVELALHDEELLFHTFMDNVPDRVYFKDLEGRFLRVNRSKLARHGLTDMGEVLGKTDFDFETEANACAARQDEAEIIRTGQPVLDREELVAHADGSRHWIATHKLPFRDASGRITGIFGISRDITDRKLFERKLQDTAQRLQMLWQSVENSPASVVMTDTQGKIEYVNPKFIEVTGYARKEVLGQNPRVLKSGQTPDRVYADMWCMLASGQNWLGELCNRRKDGSLFWESASISPVKNEAGAVVSYLAIKEDITAKKLAQQKADREADRQMQQKGIITRLAVTPALTEGQVEQVACELTEQVGRAFGIARVGVWLFNEDETRLRCTDLYDAVARTHTAGVELDEAHFHNEFEALKHANYIDAHDPLTDPRTAGYVESYLRPLQITSMLDAVVRAGGRTLGVVCLEHVNQPHRWEPDEIAFACQLADQINLTLLNRDRRRAELELQRSVSLLQATLQSTADGILVVDRTGKITSFNDRLAELWRIPASLLSTRDDAAALNHILVQLKHPETFAARVHEVYAAPERDSFDVIEFLDGRVFERHSRPQWVNGQPVGRVWSFRDVTPQRHAEAEQHRLLADLARSNKELEQFAYVASHDLQEPLRLVSSYTQLLLQRYRDRLDAGADPLVNFITEGVTRMQRLIQDLLAYSRVSSKSNPFARIDGNRPLAAALQNLTLALREQQAVVTHDPLPELLGDETQMIQLFQNLIGNALKFRRLDEPPRVHVGVRRADEADAWLFSVQDNGIGIAPEYYERIFVIFQRLHSRQKYAGTGIGLTICKRIVERHGGRIWVESPNGGGTIFCFTMPAVAP